MTMKKATNTIAAGKFKATCLQLLDDVAQSGRELVVTKRGKPVARLVPMPPEDDQVHRTPPAELKGSVLRYDHPTKPVFRELDWSDDAGA